MLPYDDPFNRWVDHYDDDIARAERSGDWMYKDYTKILTKIVDIVNSWKTMERKSIALDIGAGTGNLTKLVHDIGYTVIGIEPADKMRKKFQGKFPSLIIMHGDFLNIPLRDDYADVIVSSYAWHHLTDNEKEESINEMVRVIKDSGLIVIADLMFADQDQRVAKINDLKQTGRTDVIEDIKSEYYADVNRISKCFNDRGFRCDNTKMTDYVWMVRAQRLTG